MRHPCNLCATARHAPQGHQQRGLVPRTLHEGAMDIHSPLAAALSEYSHRLATCTGDSFLVN
ncbi:hypothetical protein SVIO_109760 [Streptomyces violaceusniger]|uniref:Uncharacterized protein n=1 Tax=Streptomyces violaceusniger TaxID=68280 RepID=A0A4D4LQJ1_STRVO|nr:hypothetical protein SVIO_109760 [Streptomyces violaceusniger]